MTRLIATSTFIARLESPTGGDWFGRPWPRRTQRLSCCSVAGRKRRPTRGKPMGIYRGFDQAALDREYSPSARVGNIMAFIRRYGELSARARDQLYVRRHLAYGPSRGETLDFFPATRV